MDTLVLLPGLHGTADLFKPLLAVIPNEIPTRVVAYPIDRVCDHEELIRLIDHQLRDVGTIILFAESFSGPLALHFATTNPSRVRAVILCSSFIASPVPRLLCYLATPIILLRLPIPNFAIRIFLSGFRAPRALVREVRHVIRSIAPRVLAHRVRQAAWVNAGEALRGCTMPVYCLAGSRDRLVGSRSHRRIRKVRPDLVVQMFDAPHLLLQIKPREVWNEFAGLFANDNKQIE